jgi:DNA-binding winged helix-turn-helix (wHTH) protein
MAGSTQLKPGYSFGVYVLDPQSGELRRNGTKLKLQEQPFHVLRKLLENSGSLVTREELHSALWPADTFVDFDTGLNSAIKRLREALGDSADVPRYIETVPRRGYRFIAPLNGARPQATSVGENSAGFLSLRRVAGTALALLCAAGIGAFVAWLRSPLPPPQITGSTQITWDGQAKYHLGSDGKSLFFGEHRGNRNVALQLPLAGGSPAELESTSPGLAPGDISPDGSQILFVPLGMHKMAAPLPSARIMDLATASIRDIPGIVSDAVGWAPGNQLVFAQGAELFLAGQDGSHRRKLLTAPGMIYTVNFSPDGTRIRMTVADDLKLIGAIWEARADGSGLHELLPGWHAVPQECCGTWTSDGRYYVFQSFQRGSSKIWIIPDNQRSLRKSVPTPVLLTTDPLNFYSPTPSRDGRKLFVMAEQPRAELVRYDSKSGQFVPFLNGISAADVEASPDTRSYLFVRYPDYTLWRSRSDGSEPIQLTNASLSVALPHWSPDGNRIAFSAQKQGQAWNI